MMPDVFDRAESWRARAAELRGLATEMQDATARQSLLANARALEEHADKFQAMLVKVCRARSRVATWGAAVRQSRVPHLRPAG